MQIVACASRDRAGGPASGRSPARCLGARPSWPLAGWKPALLAPCQMQKGRLIT